MLSPAARSRVLFRLPRLANSFAPHTLGFRFSGSQKLPVYFGSLALGLGLSACFNPILLEGYST